MSISVTLTRKEWEIVHHALEKMGKAQEKRLTRIESILKVIERDAKPVIESLP